MPGGRFLFRESLAGEFRETPLLFFLDDFDSDLKFTDGDCAVFDCPLAELNLDLAGRQFFQWC